jgi:hypothetical protein
MIKTLMLTGIAIAASLLSYAPIAEAAPIAAARAVSASSVEAPVVQVVTRAGVAHRSTRRTTRRVMRR